MIQNKIVVRYQNGRIVKGHTSDFLPTKEIFHVTPIDQPRALGREVSFVGLKAVFFVKDLVGTKEYNDKKEFDAAKPPAGRKIRVQFSDGEVLVGTTHGYQPHRIGFFLIPADPKSNIERCFVVAAATEEILFLRPPRRPTGRASCAPCRRMNGILANHGPTLAPVTRKR